jgi:hypothetical protein
MIGTKKLMAKRTFHRIVEQHLGFTYSAFDTHAPNPEGQLLIRAWRLSSVSLSGPSQKTLTLFL